MKSHLLIAALAGTLTACDKDDAESEVTTLRVNYYRQTCQGEGTFNCLLVQEGKQIGTTSWYLFYNEIEGFQFEAGYIYTLKVRKEKVNNPPADASSLKYSLIEVLAKEKV